MMRRCLLLILTNRRQHLWSTILQKCRASNNNYIRMLRGNVMDARIPEDKKVSQAESALMVARIPDLASKHLERVPSFKLPKINRKDNEADDLPDITPELTERLRSLWSLEDVFEEQPARMLVDAVT